jgi:hypothetical protein
MSDSPKSFGRIFYLGLMTVYLALVAAVFLWPVRGLWMVPAWLMNPGVICGLLLLFASFFCLKPFRRLAALGLFISFVTLAMLLLPTL